MMKGPLKFTKSALVLLLLGAGFIAQSFDKDDDKQNKPKKKEYRVPVYLGETNLSGGNIPEKLFDSLISIGLTSKDTLGRPHKVTSFMFTYAERNLYEDAEGNLLWLTDLRSAPSKGDTLETYVLETILERTKNGDTVYFDNITVLSPDTVGYNGKSMMFVLTK